jgi:hypothetical protein
MISVVVPAHNEARVIERCLRAMTAGAKAGELEVVVVCNGCTDETEAVARRFGPPVRVLSTTTASKTGALNLGDSATTGFPRFYADADVVLPLDSIRAVAEVLASGAALAAAPRIRIETGHASWPVRAFYRVWTEVPYFHTGMLGAGVSAVSEEGRARFRSFPDVIADDEFLRLHFRPEERRSVPSCTFTVFAPVRFAGLLRIKTRSRLGRLQLARHFPELARRDRKPWGATLARIARRPRLWVDLPVYLLVTRLTHFFAARRARKGRYDLWDRDESSRVETGSLPLGAG